MKFTYLLLSSLCILVVNSKVVSLTEPTSEPSSEPTELPYDEYENRCLEGVDETLLIIECEENRNGKFYEKFHPYPECRFDTVCFLPPEKPEEIHSSCIYISGKQYCKTDIHGIDACNPDNDDYDFKTCVEEAKKYFEDFEYEIESSAPTPTPVSTISSETTTIPTTTKTPKKCIVRNKNKVTPKI